MSQPTSKPNAADKFAKSRMFNFKGYVNEEINLKAGDVPFNNPVVEYKLECKKCKKEILVDKDYNRQDIRCCKEKKVKEKVSDEDAAVNSMLNALTKGLDKEEKEKMKKDENIKEKVVSLKESFLKANTTQ